MANDIDFAEYGKDLFALAEDDRLSQFQQSCVMTDVLNALVKQTQDANDAAFDVIQKRSLTKATGTQLDIIGRIVGQDRTLLNQAEKPYFKPDAPGIGFDAGKWFAEGAPLTGNLPADDGEYLNLIQSKIFKNHVQGATVPELLNFAKIVYGINISVKNEGVQDISLIIPATAPSFAITTLTSEVTDARADHQSFVPLPTGVRIIHVILRPTNGFAFDRESGRLDYASFSIEVF